MYVSMYVSMHVSMYVCIYSVNPLAGVETDTSMLMPGRRPVLVSVPVPVSMMMKMLLIVPVAFRGHRGRE